ncbi:uncharacterized protein TNCV_4386201 [Trichonephila clavipes]|nr:uncharacterized protein TNCV_4386201 [Trichonephila clavipes]
MKIGNNGNLVLGPLDESTPCLMIVLMNCQTKLRINHLTAVKSVTILEIDIASTSDLFKRVRQSCVHRCRLCYEKFSQPQKPNSSLLFISINIKLGIYKTLINPIALYGSEYWTLNKAKEEKLILFERKILRKIFRPIQENNEWRILYHHEIYRKYRKYGGTDIVRSIKASSIRCLSHLYIYADAFPANKVIFSKIAETSRRGRPPTLWLDNVEKELKLMGINR